VRLSGTEQSPAFSEPVGLTERVRVLRIPAVPNVPLWQVVEKLPALAILR